MREGCGKEGVQGVGRGRGGYAQLFHTWFSEIKICVGLGIFSCPLKEIVSRYVIIR